MTDLNLAAARTIVDAAAAYAQDKGLKPLGIVVLDARGSVRAAITQDGGSLKRYEMAYGKANGAIALGLGTRTVFNYPEARRFFLSAAHTVTGPAIFFPGGVLVRDGDGALVGAVGISGDVSDNDEAAAMAGIEAAGFVGDPGA
ncbi:GlcG/HbpS family heme-binding protein [Terrihabitans rhizophilus]|uniref:Heme-binding protein n=1 Tax=Terrihabitans rhizophilus TaxID=3092662 RepID=A0ABU4RLM9_9HYPH|nr:heme-binding protein [Terrihabitans sp. PJ23]MDX6805715.1 heme-binding protein [Terrihabitans sp. PJ23]